MKLSQALKQKSRLAGEISRQQQILLRENARRSDSTSTVDRQEVWNKIQSLSEELWKLKGKIAKANININPALERMAEYKTHITFLKGLNIREGEEIILVGRDQEKLVYKWNSFLNQARCDEHIEYLQRKINEMQDEVDIYNATTEISD